MDAASWYTSGSFRPPDEIPRNVPPEAQLDAEAVHHLDAGAAKGSRLPFLMGLGLLLVLAAGGAWVVLADPFASSAGALAPPAAADNLLGEAWSFETTETSSPGQAWMVPADAPAGFAFSPDAARSGAAGAEAVQNDEGWSRILSTQAVRLDGRAGSVELAAESASAGIQLLLRFEGEGRAPFDVVVASGAGSISGQTLPPPGFSSVRAGLGCVGAGRADDLSLRFVDGGPAAQVVSFNQGIYDLSVGPGRPLTIQRDKDLVMRVGPTSVRPAEGRPLPGTAAWLPGEQALALAGGGRVGVKSQVEERSGALLLTVSMTSLPAGATLVTPGLLTGALAAAPMGVRSGGRYDRFTDDFSADGVDSLVLGRTQDRLVIDLAEPFSISATHQADGSVSFLIERQAQGSVRQVLTVRSGFGQERVQAAGLLDEAGRMESSGRPGQALAILQRIVTEFPYDEQVLEQASAARARLTVASDERLRELRADLEDALFLGNPGRCRQVADATAAAAARWTGSVEEAAAWAVMQAEVAERTARILGEVDDRRLLDLTARLKSFELDGRFPHVVAELKAELAALAAHSGPAHGEQQP